MYKLLDTILNMKLQKELYDENTWKLNEGQTGFKKGMGCEVNILRITEYMKMKFEQKNQKRM